MTKAQSRRKLVGFHYDPDKLFGWRLGQATHKVKACWVLTDDGRRCIREGHVLAKWSLIGTRTLLYHPRPVTDADYCQYDPPRMPEGLRLVYKEAD